MPTNTPVPSWVPARYHDHWRRPHTRKAKHSLGFRRLLARHGLLTPHFSLAEAACHDGTPVPKRLRPAARNHAFNLERLRQQLGDVQMPVVSWYRTRAYNKKVHGARLSQHVRAVATDHSKEWVDLHGWARVQLAADHVFSRGGVGTYPGGSMHFDSRGRRARWSSYTPT